MADDDPITLTLVIPVYNGARFLASSLQQAHDWLKERPFGVELLVVDDGSSDGTQAVMDAFVAEHPTSRCRLTFLRNARNRGKGFSVRRAFLHAAGDLVVFTDADLTYPITNCEPLVDALRAGADLAYGSRMHADSRYVVAPSFFGKLFTRHFMGRTFNLLLRLLVAPGVMDSQAGLKGCRRDAARQLATRVQLPRFSFDVEMFFVAARLGLRIAECPVQFIYRKEPTTVRFVRDSLAMVRDMLRVRWRCLRGVYEREPDPAMVQDLRDGGATSAVEAVADRRRAALDKCG
jgi:glycosyltransferase involved in cell wall biosynthesis